MRVNVLVGYIENALVYLCHVLVLLLILCLHLVWWTIIKFETTLLLYGCIFTLILLTVLSPLWVSIYISSIQLKWVYYKHYLSEDFTVDMLDLWRCWSPMQCLWFSVMHHHQSEGKLVRLELLWQHTRIWWTNCWILVQVIISRMNLNLSLVLKMWAYSEVSILLFLYMQW